MVSACKPVTSTCVPTPRCLTLSACVRLLLAVAFAAYLLFWLFEGLGPRMDVIADWSIEHNLLTFEDKGGVVYPPGILFSTSVGIENNP